MVTQKTILGGSQGENKLASAFSTMTMTNGDTEDNIRRESRTNKLVN